MTNGKLLNIFQALNELANLQQPVYPNGKVSYMITKNVELIRQATKAYEEERKKLFGDKFDINDFPEEKRTGLQAKLAELLDEESEIQFHKCAYEHFNATENKIPLRIFVALSDIVVYSEEDMK